MNKTVHAGLNVHKAKIAVAIAKEGRGGEVKFYGAVINSADADLRLTKMLAKNGGTPSFGIANLFARFDLIRASSIKSATEGAFGLERTLKGNAMARRPSALSRTSSNAQRPLQPVCCLAIQIISMMLYALELTT